MDIKKSVYAAYKTNCYTHTCTHTLKQKIQKGKKRNILNKYEPKRAGSTISVKIEYEVKH